MTYFPGAKLGVSVRFDRDCDCESRISHRRHHHLHHHDTLLQICFDRSSTNDPIVTTPIANRDQQRQTKAQTGSKQYAQKVTR